MKAYGAGIAELIYRLAVSWTIEMLEFEPW
jgi:hypothetical protein